MLYLNENYALALVSNTLIHCSCLSFCVYISWFKWFADLKINCMQDYQYTKLYAGLQPYHTSGRLEKAQKPLHSQSRFFRLIFCSKCTMVKCPFDDVPVRVIHYIFLHCIGYACTQRGVWFIIEYSVWNKGRIVTMYCVGWMVVAFSLIHRDLHMRITIILLVHRCNTVLCIQ